MRSLCWRIRADAQRFVFACICICAAAWLCVGVCLGANLRGKKGTGEELRSKRTQKVGGGEEMVCYMSRGCKRFGVGGMCGMEEGQNPGGEGAQVETDLGGLKSQVTWNSFCFVLSAGLGHSKTTLPLNPQSVETQRRTPAPFITALGFSKRGKSGTLQARFGYTAREREKEGENQARSFSWSQWRGQVSLQGESHLQGGRAVFRLCPVLEEVHLGLTRKDNCIMWVSVT